MPGIMPQERHPRGFKILDRYKKPKKSISLFAKNGSRFVVLINYYFWGLCFRSRWFEFNDLQQARDVFHRLKREKNPEYISGPLLQKQSAGF